ncbi:MAG: polyketide cyclase [Rikenellaceae bacterium]|nr:polyketide cyclase [Rikenellaceae bacterium]
MEKYESKQVQINKPAWMVYNTMSDFNNFTPILQDKVEGWQATGDTCQFRIKGFTVKLAIVEREEFKTIKIVGEDGTPFDFTFWIQMREIDQTDTRMRLVLHVNLNMMMKMMVGGKIRDGLDQVAEQIAESFNRLPV